MDTSTSAPPDAGSERASAGSPLVSVEGVTKVYLHEGREVPILNGIDLTLERGEMLAVVGPSGAGKSTLLHILGTLDLPTEGAIRFEGEDVTRYSNARLADFRNRTLGFVFQFHHLLPEFTALENVMMPGLIRGASRRELRERARSLLEEVGLSHRLTHRPGELSGGEQQRVALARALSMQPKLILADEPTGNLDSKTSDAIHRLFFELNEAHGTTFLIVTHSEALAARMPRTVSMKDGKIDTDLRQSKRVAEPSPAEVASDAAPASPAPAPAEADEAVDEAPDAPAPTEPAPPQDAPDPRPSEP